ncbi:MAG: Uma2 family endonuclease [Microcoleus sp. PH2017_29_MFU_D_A]|uniref:Uma2 family endonuclease n=1 Tax=unclassified Microcoleus TaxID=2642155 RepID=UPI001DA8E478|nr:MULTISPECIES: Uma2 family endonuclease [unclassified Microcoleus]MCC3418565.1 Uma2 family endonuclease [Microcoleus sp. PH2017_07_MST_O_A]MCC3430209.1 Uma2 family endonuclease [Microcoleus sp. PH2017_04_SCI_O_A]MCC3506473.1 Uma2 family endonuclease [Microcoleus sp. PH2017_19_SFW_U_A]MCC3511259.1 Uma2 family endonuclease [Microcoleus sp. PH2017_17_BER_D_A]TAE07643.1 MAG: Uma2 family endonuclease [Oscillatoriales cyanobacterium]
MIQTTAKLLTFEEFIEWYPDGKGRFELRDGVIVEMNPNGDHEEVTSFLIRKINVEIDRLNLSYITPSTYFVKPLGATTGYQPDIIVLDKPALISEPLWKKSSIITQGKSVKLAIEVVSTNWQDDYLVKVADYERLGIPEYWVVDYAALGGRRFIGNPKQPTISVYQLVEGEYQASQFREGDRILSCSFPELNLTVEQVFGSIQREE